MTTNDDGPPLFDGEPEHCSLCGEPGHTHDDHWLFQHEPVQALVARLTEAQALLHRLGKSTWQTSDLALPHDMAEWRAANPESTKAD